MENSVIDFLHITIPNYDGLSKPHPAKKTLNYFILLLK